MSSTAPSPTVDQARLAAELGWEDPAEEELDWLQCLLDDEFEQLGAGERVRLRERLGSSDQALACEVCGNVVLTRYRPDDARCRVCAVAFAGDGRGWWSPPAAAEAQAGAESVDAPWVRADALSLGRTVVLDPENEDWDDRQERLELERAEAERRRRSVELAQRQVEERRREREERRKEMATLIPPVQPDRILELKRRAHAQIEERLQQNRRRRRLLRGKRGG